MTEDKALARFSAALVQRDGCLIYENGCYDGTRAGHRRVWFHGQRVLAHRLAWELAHGPIPDGLCVLHRCDVPACVNVEHLWLGTKRDNNADRDAKGRHVPLRGSANGVSRLTEDDVRVIRQASADGETARSIARRFSVSGTTVGLIVQRKRWAHVR